MSDKSEVFVEEIERTAPETIVILGAPGSGKDTQANYLVQALGYEVISTGDLMRILAGHNEKVAAMMKKGELIPDSVVEDELISAFVLLPEGQPVIVDGYPRNVEQAQKLTTILEQNKRKLDKVIYIKVDEDQLIKRISKRRVCTVCGAVQIGGEKCNACGGPVQVREDDKPESVKKRLGVFHELTEPMISFFKKEGVLVEVNGNPAPEEVREEIRNLI
jgi:adenylate kinase